MFAATSSNPDFYDYEFAAGAVGVYYTEDGGCSTSITIAGRQLRLFHGVLSAVGRISVCGLYGVYQ